MMEHTAKATQEQQKGTAHLLESVSDVKDAADIVKRGAEEEDSEREASHGSLA